MAEVTLAFMAHDVHELGCHFVARHAGLYQRHGLKPRLLDAAVMTGNLPERSFQAACGAALAAWLKGTDIKVIFAATDRPMFWLYGQQGVNDVTDLRRARIAGYPAAAPPAAFLRELLARRGLADAGTEILPARDDVARLGMLKDGSVAAALLSSAIAPDVMAGLGFTQLIFLGDELRVVTTGLAVTPGFWQREPGLSAAMCRCYADAQALIHNDPDSLSAALRAAVVPVQGLADGLAAVLRDCYTRDGRSPLENVMAGVGLMAAALGVSKIRPAGDLYDFSLLGGHS